MARIIPDPAKAASAPVASPAAARPAPKRGVLRYVWPFVCLMQLGLIGGWLFTRYWHPAHPIAEEPSAEEKSDRQASRDSLKPGEVPTVEHGDELLREGRYDLALKVYEPLAGTATGALRDALQYRVGLCQEGLGQNEQALKAYRVVRRTENPRAAAASDIGQARVLVRLRKPVEAKNLLYPLLLRSATPELRGQACLADARYLLALTLTLEALKPEKPGPLSDAPADYTATDWPVEAALDWVGAATEAKPETPDKPDDAGKETKAGDKGGESKDTNYVVLVGSADDPQSGRVTAAVSQGALLHLIDRLATKAKLKVDWSESAKKIASERGAALTVEDVPVSDMLLDVILPLTDPLGILPTIKNNTLRLTTEAEMSPEAVAAYRTETAKRALTIAVTSNPGHRLTAAAYLELGNLDSRAGRLKDAGERYIHLCYEYRRSPLLIEASYNLGLVRLKQWEMPEARAAFYTARDHAPGHELAPLALLQVGRTFLLEGTPEQAIKPLRDALAVSGGTAIEPAAALTLAAAQLLTDQPQAASRTVREHRESIGQQPYRTTGIFLDAYAQFMAVKSKASAHEASELLAALWAVEQKEPVLGLVGPLLMGHAYRDLDHPDDMIAVYQKGARGSHGPLAAEMSFAVAEDLYQRNQRDAARKHYVPLAKGDEARWAGAAQLRLAEIALQENRPKDALQACQKLLEDKQSVKRETVLMLMGRAYEKTGEYRQAARCFAGQLPD
jgi:tetratricopeptide (TPR) repeat protein